MSGTGRDGELIDFFISYTKTDEAWAEWIQGQLEANGQTTVLQSSDFLVGENFVHKIDTALKQARRTVAVLSEQYLRSPWCTAEWTAALSQSPLGEGQRLIPVRIADCKPDGLLSTIQYIDLVGLSQVAARQRLLERLRLRAGRERSPATAEFYPGHLRQPWSVPHRANPNFIDRDDLLGRLHAMLQGDGVTHCAVVGLAGLGKTQLVAAYIYEHARERSLVWWVSATDHNTLRRDYTKLAEALGIEIRPEDGLNDLLAAVRDTLEGRPGDWLLVLDDATDPQVIWDLMPKRGGGKVIVTSRDRAWRTYTPIIELGTYTEADAVNFLLARTGETDEEAAGAVARLLGYHPLALEQAAAYVVNSQWFHLADYAREFARPDRVRTMLSQTVRDSAKSVADAFEPGFEKLREKSPESADLLCLLAFLAPDDIPILPLLTAGPRVTGPLAELTKDRMAFEQAVEELNRYSFLRGQKGDFIAVHMLVQTVVKAYLDPDERVRWGGTAVALLGVAFPERSGEPETWEACTRLLPHITAVARSTEAAGADPLATASLLSRAGGYLRHRSGFSAAEGFLRDASGLLDANFQSVFSTYVDTHERLGRVLCSTGRLDDARLCFEQALRISQAVWGEQDRRVARLRERIGFEVLRPKGDLKGAKRMLEAVIRTSRPTDAESALQSAHAHSKLGFVLWDMKAWDQARKSFTRAIDLFTIHAGARHPDVARAKSGLGQVHVDQNQLAEARRCQEEALELFRERLGDSDIDVARTRDKLGYVVCRQGEPGYARSLHLQALDLYRLIFRDGSHREIAFALSNLGLADAALGDVASARQRQEEALSIFRAVGDERWAEEVRKRLDQLPEG